MEKEIRRPAKAGAGPALTWDRQARAFKVLQSMTGDAVRSSGHVEAQLAAYLGASPKLATYLARWQADSP